jgi:hypothetical protein
MNENVQAVIQLLLAKRDALSEDRDRLAVEVEQFPSIHTPVGAGPEDGNYPKWIHTVPGNEETAKLYDELGRKVRDVKNGLRDIEYVVQYLESL